MKIGQIDSLTCPAFGCNILVDSTVVERLVSRETARRYLQFDVKAFVDCNPYIKWCPHPGAPSAGRLASELLSYLPDSLVPRSRD